MGRERELEELQRLLGATRALTLSGPGGIGKTRLAQRLVAYIVDGFPDGAWFVDLSEVRQPDLVVPRVATALGVGEEPRRAPLETLAEALRHRRMLLVLDNCEHMVDMCAHVCRRLLAGSPGLHLITTSREPLRMPGETVWQVPPLGLAPPNYIAAPEDPCRYEAVRLFADRAAAASPGFFVGAMNAAHIAALCRALDGMPLAIELAAARVRALSIDQISLRLGDRFALLTAGERTAPPRQRTLRAAIDWSYDLLTPIEQVLLRRLSVFAGWSLEMAEQVCADDAIHARDILGLTAALVDKSLVAVEPDALGQARYRLLETVREYAAEKLTEAGEGEVFRGRMRDYTVTVAERNFAVGLARVPGTWRARVDVFRRYDIEHANIGQVLTRCLEDGDAQAGLRICNAVRPCWLVRGTYAEGGEWLDSLLALDTDGVAPDVRAAGLVGRAQLALPSDPASARSWALQGLEQSRAAEDVFWTASALNLLSEVALHTGQQGDAAALADEALTIAKAAKDGWNEGYALGIQAALAGVGGRLAEAQRLAKSSMTVMRRIDQQWGVARALLGLGDLARVRGRPGEARRHYLGAVAILKQIDARPEMARGLAGLGRVAIDMGAPRLARQHLAESIQVSHATGARIGIARGLEAFAALAVKENHPELAVRLIAASTALREAAGLAPLPGARLDRYLAPGRRLGEPAIARLWSQGLSMDSDSAVALALGVPDSSSGADGADPTAFTLVRDYEVATAPPSMLTPREREIVALVVGGRSNKAIAQELMISPATVARHLANILAKLGFSSRTQVAAWAADKDVGLAPERGQQLA